MTVLTYVLAMLCVSWLAQEPSAPDEPAAHTIIFNTGTAKPPAFLYSASTTAEVQVGVDQIDQRIELRVRVLQGAGQSVSLGLGGTGTVLDVQGAGIAAWAVRTADSERFLDLQLKTTASLNQPQNAETDSAELSATIFIRSEHLQLPARVELAHLKPGQALGFDNQLQIKSADGVVTEIVTAEGFAPLLSPPATPRLQTTSGGRLELQLLRSYAVPSAIELRDSTLIGTLHPSGKSLGFQLHATATVNEAGARLRALSGEVALSGLPTSEDYYVELSQSASGPVYELVFPKTGAFPVTLDFVAALSTDGNNWQGLSFIVAASSVVPVRILGLDTQLEFARDPNAIVPLLVDKEWRGFLPASGQVNLRWRAAQSATESKTFFTTNSTIEATVDPGVLRQDHIINYQLLQGQLKELNMRLVGPGEILTVEGANIVAWNVSGADDARWLRITLNQPLTSTGQFTLRSQTPLGQFPARLTGLSVQPEDAIRNSGHLRLSSAAAVNVEPAELRGLTQLAPEQFPGPATQARQQFVYRFPSSEYAFSLMVDRVQPEISVTELVLYQLSESDRVILVDAELDVREATIRQWVMTIPADYSVVSVTGASVADYMISSEVIGGVRDLKVLFAQEIQGRQLVTVRLEKNEAAGSGQWKLPRIDFPEAKTVRGDIGMVMAPGFRASIDQAELLVEKPLSYFPKSVPNLQHAYRMRQPNWSATLQIEQLEQSVQTDTFHLLSLVEQTIYGSALINYTITGAPVSELRVTVPAALGNITVDGASIRTWRREGDALIVSLQQSLLGTYTLLITFEDKPNAADGSFASGMIVPVNVQSDRGYVHVVSPVQVALETLQASNQLLVLDPSELPAELRLLSTAPALGTWQYTQRPFDLRLKVNWFTPGTTAVQVVEYSEANSRVSQDGELVTDVVYYVKSRGQQTLKIRLPGQPVRLWAVSVNGQSVTARQAGDDTLIPLPTAADPNEPIEVTLRLGKPAQAEESAKLQLPTLTVPVLKTQWQLQADENRVLLPRGGSIEPTVASLGTTGFMWLAERGLLPLGLLAGLALVASQLIGSASRMAVLVLVILVSAATGWLALKQITPPVPLQFDLPVLASGEVIEITVANVPTWRAAIVWPGVMLALPGGVLLVISILVSKHKRAVRLLALALIAVGLLLQINSAALFFALVALAVGVFQVVPIASELRRSQLARGHQRVPVQDPPASDPSGGSIVTTSLLICCLSSLIASWSSPIRAADDAPPPATSTLNADQASLDAGQPISPASSLFEKWTISSRDQRVSAMAEMSVSGRTGDRFLLLSSPAVLTEFTSQDLRLTKVEVPGQGIHYFVIIPSTEAGTASSGDSADSDEQVQTPDQRPLARRYTMQFQYHLEAISPTAGITVPSGRAAVHQIQLVHDQPGWEIACAAASRIELDVDNQTSNSTSARLLLTPSTAQIKLLPPTRDLANEATQFFVEGAELYTPGPGAIDGLHRFKIRTSQGRIPSLEIVIPAGLTVSAVAGPVDSWQFNADAQRLKLNIIPAAPADFDVTIETQRGLSALPTEAELSPLRVEGAVSSVGLIALAFGTEAQPDNVTTSTLSPGNLADFDTSLLADAHTTLHRVFRYGNEGGTLKVQVAPVTPELRVNSRQVISYGDERLVMAVNFSVEITRTGLFQFSFPLPESVEVESLTGDALHHWSELTVDGRRQIVLHLKGKTLGAHSFSLTLAGAVAAEATQWVVPRFELNESTRQSGELVVQPATGIRLRTLNRQNVSETDPRTLGAQGPGALAFRLLQNNWTIGLGIEKLEPWITGQLLHDVTVREGQSRTIIVGDLNVQNAAIRTLQMRLPALKVDQIKSLRATGEAVNDFIKLGAAEDMWELHFKRRVIGPVKFQIEFEGHGERPGNRELLHPIELPAARQLAYYFAVRAGGRLEIEPVTLTQGWQRADWSTVPQALREAGNRQTPALSLRAIEPTIPMTINLLRHSLAESLKLRVTSGMLTTILSPTGDQLTSLDVTVDVIQRSNLSIGLPAGGELFSIFVNGESVHSVRQSDSTNTWQFSVLPGLDDRTAHVRLVYSLMGEDLSRINLVSPQLDVPLENITWRVIAPEGFQLLNSDGNMELVEQATHATMDRESYLSSINGRREADAQQATRMLEQANQLLQQGEQSKAQWALGNVANRFALDAASNEDARVQLENLQTQQAIVGLNTRRQRLLLDNARVESHAIENDQLLQAADLNPILRQEQLNYKPQELSQLLAGNSQEEVANLQRIAGRLVQHQRTSQSAPPGISSSLPEDGTVHTFRRSVQVQENAPLELNLQFHPRSQLRAWQWSALAGALAILSLAIVSRRGRS